MQQAAFDRIYSAAETFDRVAPHLSSFGITRLARHTGLDRIGIPVWCAYTPNARSIVVAQGKGVTEDDARTSATMEALERAVACAPHVARSKARVTDLTRRGVRTQTLPGMIAAGRQPLAEDDEIDWVAGRDLVSGAEVFVPFDAVALDRTVINSRYWQSSDGLASGNTLDEAIFHGLMERVERDATVLWQLRTLDWRQATCIAPDSFRCTALTDLRTLIDAAGLTIRLFDLTGDLGIPCFAAFLGPAGLAAGSLPASSHLRHVDVTFGAGAHVVASRAALRAVTEAAQSRLTHISGARDDVLPADYEKPLAESTRLALAAQPMVRDIDDRPVCGPEDLAAYLHERQAGPMIAVPLSRPGLPFAVAKVLAPGLENPDGNRRQRFGTRALRQALAP